MLSRPMPEAVPSMRELVAPAAVAAAGAAALAAKGLLLPLNMYDAGISASAGTFILHSLVPYRDFWMLYGPLGGYLAALVGLIFPPSVTTIQLVGLALVAAEAAAGCVLLRYLHVAPTAGLLIAIVATAASSSLIGLEISEWQCAVVAALLALAVTCVSEAPRSRLLAGAIVGLSILFRQDVGLYALIAVLVATRSARPVIGVGLVVGPVVLILLAIVPINALYEQLIWYPIVGTRVYRALPDALSQATGPIEASIAVLFVWGARASIIVAAVRAITSRDSARLGLVVLALLCQLQALGRGDFYHFAQAAGPAFLCLGVAFTPKMVASRTGAGTLAITVPILAIVAVVSSSIVPLTPPASYQASVEQAAAYVRQNTAQTEAIFVGLTSNRYTFANPLMVYYLADRRPGVRDTIYNPGVTNHDSTQLKMIGDLNRSGTRYLVLDRLFASTCEPANSSCQPGSSRLDDFIASEFRTTAAFGDIVVMARP